MPQVSFDCPHCHTAKSALQGVSPALPVQNHNSQALMCFVCSTCSEATIIKFEVQSFELVGRLNDPQQAQPRVVASWPKPAQLRIPANLPPNVSRYYFQAKECITRKNWDAAGMMCRKTLQSSLRTVAPDGPSNLSAHIKALTAEQGVTPAMKEWADAIRHLGNDAAHEDDPFTEQEARSISAFTETFLTYVFTMPAMLAERRAAAATT